jgi:riboflavin kinase / FMN adenylyltransferase
MQVFRRLPAPAQRQPSAVTIGNFDGVHLGHQALLRELVGIAQERHLTSTVLTFEPHPREYFAKIRNDKQLAPARVATLRDRLLGLARCEVDRVCVAHFNTSLASVSAEAFIEQILVEGLQTKYLLVGDDFRFGAQRRGDFAMLQRAATRYGFELTSLPTRQLDGQRVSSSAVRAALSAGDLRQAALLLGGNYSISGHVIHGKKLGRTWNFPTLNVRLPYGHQFGHPALSGIFVVQVHALGDVPLPAVASLGTRPAVESNGDYLLEVHLFDFDRSVYGQIVRVEFLHKLRDERNFPSLDLMVQQIQRDAQAARDYFSQAS